jgi:hypothetical protein
MLGVSRSSGVPEDPSVARIELILGRARQRYLPLEPKPEDRPVTAHALWICACLSMDDAPTWLIYDRAEDTVAWCRVPDAVEPLDLVDARSGAGGHADPSEVLRWLQGRAPDPWASGGDGDGDGDTIEALSRNIRAS